MKVEEAVSNIQNQMMRFAEGIEPYIALQMAIEALSGESIKWHPYPQDKPKESNDVLITKRGIVRIASMHGHIWVIAEDGKCVDDSGITAWAELPKPYEEGAEDGKI